MKKMIVIVFVLIANKAFSQSPILDTYIHEGVEANLQLKKEHFSVQAAIVSLKEAKSLFFPEMSLNAKYQFAKGGRKIDVPMGDMLNPVYNTLNQLTNTQSFPQLENMEIPLMPTKYQETFIGSALNLLNTDLYFNYRAKKQMINVRTAQMEAFRNVLKQQISNAYLEYLLTLEAKKIVETNKRTVQELKRLNEKFFQSGIRTKDALTDSEYELSLIEAKMTESNKNIELARSYFNYLLNRELDHEILVDSSITQSVDKPDDIQLPATDWIGNRQELNQLSSLIDANKEYVKMHKLSYWVPKVFLATNIGYQGYGYKFNRDQFYNYQQFGLRWVILNGGNKGYKVKQAKVSLLNAENQYQDLRNQLELEVKKTFEEYISSKENYKSAQKAQQAAEESYELVYKKYEQNQVLWLELIDKQNKMLSAQMQLSLSKYNVLIKKTNYKKSIADL